MTYDEYLEDVIDYWGYIMQENMNYTAPVWVGEVTELLLYN